MGAGVGMCRCVGVCGADMGSNTFKYKYPFFRDSNTNTFKCKCI